MQVGDKVLHSTFGIGTLIKLNGTVATIIVDGCEYDVKTSELSSVLFS